MMSQPAVLLTKITIPPLRANLIPRSPLIERLSTNVPLVLLSASAGFGKTTLLSAWASEAHGHVAWLTLDEQDNDPARFWVAVLAALRHSDPGLGEAAFALLNATPASPLATVLTELLNDLATRAEETALILDDYQVIDEPGIHQSLTFVLAHAPACLHLVLSTRVDPELPLARLRARGQLVEIRDTELRLTPSEAAHFLAQTMELSLPEEDAYELWQRTEGWIAGLQLAALSLRTHPHPSTFVQQFRGSHRFLLDYVQDDILGREPLSTQSFLLRTSVLSRMNAALCQAVTGSPSIGASQEMLEALERTNLFVVPLDDERRWYRYHPLFREALFARLQAVEPELLPLLHERAARWYAGQELLHEAIPHALEASNFDYAADLIERSVVPRSWRNEYQTLRSFLSRLPQEVLSSRPELSLLLAQALFLTTQVGSDALPRMEALLADAEHGYRKALHQAGIGSVLSARAILASFQGDFPAAFAQAREALALLEASDVQWRGLCLSIQGLEALMEGSVTLARTHLQQALVCYEVSGQLGGRQFVTAMLAEVRLVQGDWTSAAQGLRQVLGLAEASPELARFQLTDSLGHPRTHFERVAWYSLAHLAYEDNRLEEAEQALSLALAEGQFSWIHVLSAGLLLQVRLLCAQGEDERAQALLETLLARPQPPEVVREIQFCQVFLAWRRGDRAPVASWAAELATQGQPLSRARQIEEGLLLARLRMALGQPEAAAQVLAPLLEEAQTQGRRHHALQILVVQALAQEAQGNPIQAKETLHKVLTAAQSQGYQRLFLEEGPLMKTLLQHLLPDLHDPALASFVRRLLLAFGPALAPAPASAEEEPEREREPLTAQEQRVLGLLAEGASNQEIARVLVIGLSTAKKHVSNILSKLGVQNRTQAIARARKDGLL